MQKVSIWEPADVLAVLVLLLPFSLRIECVSLSLFLGRYGKAWQSPDITLLLMLDIFTSSQSGESNPSSTQRFFGDWCEQKRLKMGWNQRDNGEEPNRTLLCFFLQEGGAAKDTRVNFTLKKLNPNQCDHLFSVFFFHRVQRFYKSIIIFRVSILKTQPFTAIHQT